jgi:hypothetical protein
VGFGIAPSANMILTDEPHSVTLVFIHADLSRNGSANGRIRPKKKEIGAFGSQTEVAQRFNGAEENSSCPIAKQLLAYLPR